MRLIDKAKFAQQLEEYFDYLTGDGELYACSTIQDMLEDQPTVNPYEWISVEDRLPERDTYVLVYSETYVKTKFAIFYYEKEDVWHYDNNTYAYAEYFGITHWMSLPTPPTEKED